MSEIFEGEQCWRKLVQEIGGGEIITESKYPGEKYVWTWNVYGKFICKGNTRNKQVLLEREKYWWGYSIWETTRKSNDEPLL